MLHDPGEHAAAALLEGAHDAILSDLARLEASDFAASPDSLTTIARGFDETGWLWFGLHGCDDAEPHRGRCPETERVLAAVPGLVNAGFSLLRPGTHLYPHRGELAGVLRCHLPLIVPAGDVGLRIGGAIVRWRPGECLVFDDSTEHEAWNHGDGDRVVLIVTFAP